jgi:hypothetical protein
MTAHLDRLIAYVGRSAIEVDRNTPPITAQSPSNIDPEITDVVEQGIQRIIGHGTVTLGVNTSSGRFEIVADFDRREISEVRGPVTVWLSQTDIDRLAALRRAGEHDSDVVHRALQALEKESGPPTVSSDDLST